MVKNDEKENKNDKILFENMIFTEREYLTSRLRAEILEETDPNITICCGIELELVEWMKSQMEYDVNPSSNNLVGAMELLIGESSSSKLFLEGGNSRIVDEYVMLFKSDVKYDYEKQRNDLDIPSLAMAVIKYIKDDMAFFDDKLFLKISEAYKYQTRQRFITERLPFVMMHRDVFETIMEIMKQQMKAVDENQLTENEIIGIWGEASIHGVSGDNFLTKTDKMNVIRDLMKVDFNYVPSSLYKVNKTD